jgi:hypothetical protein
MRPGDGEYERVMAHVEGAIAAARAYEKKYRRRGHPAYEGELGEPFAIICELRGAAEALFEALEDR